MRAYREKAPNKGYNARSLKKRLVLTSKEVAQFQEKVYCHYKQGGRVLPWRKTRDPYKILVSEIMLQQTQVARVIQKYEQFVGAFPNIESVARAPLRDIMKVWHGLGYNRRALALKKLATTVVDQYDGKIPSSVESLRSLPGIGPCTAHAICTFAFNQPTVFIETNIRTVFIHHFFENSDNVKDAEILPLIADTLHTRSPRIWYFALMDYGASLKDDHANPSRRSAHYKKQTPFEGSDRQIRGMILRALVSKRRMSEPALFRELSFDKERVKRNLRQLDKEGFIIRTGKYLSIK